VSQLFERLRFDLTDPFAGDAEDLAHFRKGVIGRAADSKAHAQNALLARG
jgi:hypothetical protein